MRDRTRAIEAMLAKDPLDVMLHYSLAMEYVSLDKGEAAVAEFRRCTELDPHYLPALVEGGKCLRSLGRHDEARETFNAALELASMKGERHMHDYIRQQLEGLPKE
jgi:Flp pilus assembly protein TadD